MAAGTTSKPWRVQTEKINKKQLELHKRTHVNQRLWNKLITAIRGGNLAPWPAADTSSVRTVPSNWVTMQTHFHLCASRNCWWNFDFKNFQFIKKKKAENEKVIQSRQKRILADCQGQLLHPPRPKRPRNTLVSSPVQTFCSRYRTRIHNFWRKHPRRRVAQIVGAVYSENVLP